MTCTQCGGKHNENGFIVHKAGCSRPPPYWTNETEYQKVIADAKPLDRKVVVDAKPQPVKKPKAEPVKKPVSQGLEAWFG